MAPEGVVAFSRFYAPQFTGLVEGPSGNFVTKIKKKKVDVDIKFSHSK